MNFHRVNAYLVESQCEWYRIVKPSAKSAGPYTAYVGMLRLGEFEHFAEAKERCETYARGRA